MAEVLSQNEINQLLRAIGLDDKKELFKKTTPYKGSRILSQKEIESLLILTNDNYKNKTAVGKIIYKLKNIINRLKPPSSNMRHDKKCDKNGKSGELTPEEIAMLLKPIDTDGKR